MYDKNAIDGIAERTPEQFHAENIRVRIRLRTEIEARRGRIHGVYCHDLPQLGVLLPKRMQEALCVSSEAYHRAMPGDEPVYRVAGAWRVTRAGRRWALPVRGSATANPVICMDTGERFASVLDAAAAKGIPRATLTLAIRQRRVVRGMRFKYASAGKVTIRPQIREAKTPVQCVETGTVYESYSDAGRAVGHRSNGIHRAVKTGGRAAGFHWRRPEPQMTEAA